MKKTIALLGGPKPEKDSHDNIYTFGKLFHKDFRLDLINFKKGHHKEFKKYYYFHQYTNLNPTNHTKFFLRQFLNLYRYCKANKPDVLFSIQRPHIDGIITVLIGDYFNIPVVVRYCGHIFDGMWQFKYSKINKFISYLSQYTTKIIFKADKIIANDQTLVDELIKWGCSKNKIKKISQFIDIEKFHPPKDNVSAKTKIGLDPIQKVVLYVPVGLDKRKGIDTFMRILPMLLGLDKTLKIFIAAKKYPKEYANEIKKIGKTRVKLLGHIKSEELVKYYQASDVFIQLSHLEGITRALLEAKASGLYIIARNNKDADKIANEVFGYDIELISGILDYKPRKNKRLPRKYHPDSIKKQYKKVFLDVLRNN